MKKPRRKAAESPESAPPPGVIPWRVPPPGSLGDGWDALIRLPPDPREAAPPARRQRVRRHRRKNDPRDVVFRQWHAPIHGLVIAAWVVLALAAASTGPLYGAMGVLAGTAFLLSIGALWAVSASDGYTVGTKPATVALGLSILLIGLDLTRPRLSPYETYFLMATASPRATLSFEARLDRAEADMRLVAETAWCASEILTVETIALGNAGVNHRVDPRSPYFRTSTLALYPEERAATPISRRFLFYDPETLPVDPFADDFRATFGVYFTERHVLVYSVGPDGEWQINPRRPVEPDDPDPEATLSPHLWSAAAGRSGAGDIVLVVPTRELERDADCTRIRRAYERRALGGR